MPGRHSKKNRRSTKDKARRRASALGLGAGASAFLALGLGPLASVPTAKADVFDDILDLAIGSAARTPSQEAVSSRSTGWNRSSRRKTDELTGAACAAC